MFNKIKGLFAKPVEEPKPAKSKRQTNRSTPKKQLSPKELATQNGEPYVAITKVEVDPANINAGAFELDWNDKFVVNLIKSGYKSRDDDTDQVIVDRWFQTVCRNIALEVYEQQAADPLNRDIEDLRRIQSKDLGNGRSEVS